MKALLSFFTVLPVRGATLEEAAREIYLLPFIGLITGLPGAVLLMAARFVRERLVESLAHGLAQASTPESHPLARRVPAN